MAARPTGLSHELAVAGLDGVAQGQSITLAITGVFGICVAVFSFDAARIRLDMI